MNALTIIVLVLWLISAIGLILFVLLHSGKGTGMSDMIASTMYNQVASTSIIERNLDRITVVFAVLFIVCLLALMLVYPPGSVAS